MPVKTFPIILEEAFMLSPKVKHFIFQAPDYESFDYLPGQFITIHFQHNGKLLRRSYSIANAPMNNNRIEFAAGFVENGPATQLLFNLKPGESLDVNGPFGRLILKTEQPKRYIFIATSTGVTPYRAMLPTLKQYLEHNPALQIVILQGVQTQEDILYYEEFLRFASSFEQVSFRAYLSRETTSNPSKSLYSGYVQTAFNELKLNPHEDIIYLCGNPGMIDESFDYLKQQEFAITNIVREKYISGK